MKKSKKFIIWLGLIIILIGGYFIADSLLFSGFKPRFVSQEGFQGNYFAKPNIHDKVAVVLLGGGQWGDYWGAQFAQKDFVGLSLPYIGRDGLPELPEEIDLVYFESAVNWLGKQPEVDPDKIIMMGASRNAELALVVASRFPELVHGVIAYSPSSVAWSNTVLPYNSDEIKASWTYKGEAVPYIPMKKITGNNTNKIETLAYWKAGLAKAEFATKAAIEVEDINGPVLLFSGKDDKVWPSAMMADSIAKRLEEHDFKFDFQNMQYENAGHLISSNPESRSENRTGEMTINNKIYQFEYGGTDPGDYTARQAAKVVVFEFIEKL